MTDAIKVGPFRLAPFVRGGKETGQWHLDVPPRFAPGGKRKRILFDTRKAAEQEAKRMLRDVQLTGRIAGYGPAPAGVTLPEAAERWQEEQAARVATQKKRANSLEADAYRLKALLAFFGTADLASLSDDRLVAYQAHRLKQGRKPSTINSEVSCLLHVLTWAHRKGLCAKVPTVEQIPVPRKRLDLPTPTEVARIMAALPKVEGVLIRFLAETGCRKGEAFHLTWDDLDEARGVVAIRRKDGFTPKTEHSDRDIHIGPGLVQALRDLKAHLVAKAKEDAKRDGGPVKLPRLIFPGRGGVVRTDVAKNLATAITKAEVLRDGKPMHLTLHMLRKSHASWQALRVDESTLQRRLGHAPGSRITRQVYVHAGEEALRAAVLELPTPAPVAAGEVVQLAKSGNKAKNKGLRLPVTP